VAKVKKSCREIIHKKRHGKIKNSTYEKIGGKGADRKMLYFFPWQAAFKFRAGLGQGAKDLILLRVSKGFAHRKFV
jgi:hypothetical protein